MTSLLQRSLRRLRSDDRGAITVEFVIWMPILMFWFIGSIAFYDAYRDRGRATTAAHVIADIVTRQTDVDTQFIADLHDLLESLVPDTPAGKWIRVTSIEYDDTGHHVQWSVATGSGVPLDDTTLDAAALPDMAELDTVIVTETFVPYRPILGWTGIAETVRTRFVPARPRFASKIVYTAN